ncbi:YdcF family protein [Streptosporangiaceae bacterium NEAU-GS5]|nr:YdcF family protein [Streptosporangiaceae bacterium NEAU-GS5]
MIALAVALGAFVAATLRLFVWPDMPVAPARVDAIIELAGPGERDPTALALARAHRAGDLAQSTTLDDERAGQCLPQVPGVTTICFHPDPETTRGEARRIGELARQRNWKSVILVTSRDHVWRATLRVSRCFPGDIYVSPSPLPPLDWFRAIPYQWAATVKALVFERDC